MAQLYPSLFTFHMLGASPGRLVKNRSQLPVKNVVGVLPVIRCEHPVRTAGDPLFFKQKQLLDLVKTAGLLSPDQQTLSSILAYAACWAKEHRSL